MQPEIEYLGRAKLHRGTVMRRFCLPCDGIISHPLEIDEGSSWISWNIHKGGESTGSGGSIKGKLAAVCLDMLNMDERIAVYLQNLATSGKSKHY